MVRPALLLLAVLTASACPPRPDPLTRDYKLDELGLTITLPGDWRGGKIGSGYIFASGHADCSLSFSAGLVGIAMSEAGARTFLEEREEATVESTSPLGFGKWTGFAGVGTQRSNPTTRAYFGYFTGPRGAVWALLTTRGRPPANAEALWKSVTISVR